MWGQMVPVAVPLKPAIPFPGSRKASSVVSRKLNNPSLSKLQLSNIDIPPSQTQPLLSSSSSSSSETAPSVQPVRTLRIRPSPELGLASLLFVLSTAFAALLSLAIFSIPTINALRKLATSMEKLSHVVSQEVPGTLLSLKLSGLEVNDLTKQLTSIRQMISATGSGKNSK
ncbi:PREDICTED: uncharacterized protein LOC101291917 [Fragaria vesca subsp. vesca]|uniref:uncharacterized protein LOC101291917 n=1 Tax=Fragaria vesca subsp. vesca TaxID=101020 RepID=UPI0002C35F54|nr:PREDICTED: uncharacterized protein LOC101291917 [Fragaria vesca subsp. vesca]XP_011462866.1 PREDICTED: uncharacterized protein LOC101291917 [Fragaria vesca subsp. vesca]XP_011462867.1 PREDICTED: uncharacterized protein LOC101291917 [Fragaria vesca subsp. vesca]